MTHPLLALMAASPVVGFDASIYSSLSADHLWAAPYRTTVGADLRFDAVLGAVHLTTVDPGGVVPTVATVASINNRSAATFTGHKGYYGTIGAIGANMTVVIVAGDHAYDTGSSNSYETPMSLNSSTTGVGTTAPVAMEIFRDTDTASGAKDKMYSREGNTSGATAQATVGTGTVSYVCVGTMSASSLSFYYNSLTPATTAIAPAGTYANANNIHLASRSNAAAGVESFKWAEMAVFRRILTLGEITSLMNNRGAYYGLTIAP